MARSLKVSPQYIEKVKLAPNHNGYPSQKAFALDIGLSLATVKNFLGGKPVDYLNFVEICEKLGLDWKQISNLDSEQKPFVNPLQDNPSIACSAYDEETWVERGELSRQLSEKLRRQLRVLIITGLTGQGKTALAERLASVELRGDWQEYKCVTFDDSGMRDFVSAADALLTQLGEEVTADERKNADGLLNRLLQKLRNHRYLVQMDSLELLLKGKGDEDTARNEFEDERWWEFFNRLLAGGECQSRLILTSQDLPTQFKSCKSRRFWHAERLAGLDENEQFELFQKLFQRDGKEISQESEAGNYLKRMGKAYEGHPLVIEVIAGEILAEPFNGNMVAYWNKYRQEFEAIEAAIGHQELQLRVKDRVRKSLERLQQDVLYAYTLLLRSSVYRHPVPETFWLSMLWSCTEEEKATALGTLESRYLVFREAVTHTGQFLLRQHKLIRNTAYELLKKISNQGLEWQDDHRIAAEMWRTAYEPAPDASNLEKVQGYLEAFHHFCEVEDWEEASQILSIRLNTPINQELHNQLGIWGYYSQQIQLYSTTLNKLNDAWNYICYSGLGNAYKSLGDYPQAIGYHYQSLTIARKICNRNDEATALGNLGNAYYSLGNYRQAIGYHHQSLTIFREIGDLYGEGSTLGNQGNTYNSLGNYSQAIEYHQQHLTIAREIGDRYGEGSALGNLAVTLFQLERYSETLENLQAALKIFREIGHRFFEAITLNSLAKIYLKLGERTLAIEYWDKALDIFIQLGLLQAKKAHELKGKLLSEKA